MRGKLHKVISERINIEPTGLPTKDATFMTFYSGSHNIVEEEYDS